MIKTKRTFLKRHFQSLVANIMKYPMHTIQYINGSEMSRLGLLQWENVMNIALISSLIFS